MPLELIGDNVYNIHFGFGDLVPVGLREKDKDYMNTLAFVIAGQGKIGRVLRVNWENELSLPIILTFDSVDSIEVVIDKLKDIRNEMIYHECNEALGNSNTDGAASADRPE